MSKKPSEAEDDFIQDGLDIANELIEVDERLFSMEHEELRSLAERMRTFADHLEVHINQAERGPLKKSGSGSGSGGGLNG
jgi:hypothetical protein